MPRVVVAMVTERFYRAGVGLSVTSEVIETVLCKAQPQGIGKVGSRRL
jgi:hypothetical protein